MTTDLNWDWSNEADFNDEKISADLLERNKYAEYIYKISSIRGKNNHFALNINAQWGAGKTHFVKRLAATIQNAHPTVYIDAWKQDYSDDPLLAIFSCIIEQLGQQSDKFITISKKVEKKLVFLFKDIAPLLIKEVINGTTGTKLGDSAKGIAEGLIKLHNNKNNAIIEIKKDISEWVQLIKNRDAMEKNLPIYIFIDELDRCRPSYAIKLLEIVKHIFDVSGVVFIISTDTNQLQHSIKVIYGHDFDASHYLSRFFDRRFILPSPPMEELLIQRTPDTFIESFDNAGKPSNNLPCDFDFFIKSCSSIFKAMDISLRESIKYYDKLCDLLLTQNKYLDSYLLLILICLNEKDNNIYSEIKKNRDLTTSTSILLSNPISLYFNLSLQKTLVDFFQGTGINPRNNLETEKASSTILQYIKSSMAMEQYKEPNSNSGRDRISWRKGGLLQKSDLDTYLKMTLARIKGTDMEIENKNYFDLVELSTLMSD